MVEFDPVEFAYRVREDVENEGLDLVMIDGIERTKRLIEDVLRLVEPCSTSPPSPTQEDSVEHGSTSSRPEADDTVEHGGNDVTVRVALEDDRIVIEDGGVGIPECEREDLFTHSHSTAEGSRGIGLVVVREIIRAHGWEITVSENEAGGARFEIDL